jgi:ribosomal protein S18 acetylase RimI-like enzyme
MKCQVLKIRSMSKDDISTVSNIVAKTLSKADSKKAKKDFQDQSNKLYVDGENFVADVNGKVVGAIGYWRLSHHPKNVVWLDWFVVDKNYQNKGIGSKLLNHMTKKLRRKGFKLICCEKSSKDTASDAFYKFHQFKPEGRIKNYWEDGGELIILAKNI